MKQLEQQAEENFRRIRAHREAVRRCIVLEELGASAVWTQLQALLEEQVSYFQLHEALYLPLAEIEQARGKALRSEELIQSVLTAEATKAQHQKEIDRVSAFLVDAMKAGKIQNREIP